MNSVEFVKFLTNLTTISILQSVRTIDENIFDKQAGLMNFPDTDLPTLDMITREGYPAEAHVVTTDDGYLLTLHRIPGLPGSSPIFIQHGFLGSSADWVISGRNRALPYLLADQGYDVWLGNARGNIYSKAHKKISTDDSKFWDFSFHEMGFYDLPAAITHVKNISGQKIIYIGHSMGTTMSYIMASERPDVAKNIRFMMSLAPVAFMSHLKSPLRIIGPFANDISWIARLIGLNEFLPRGIFIKMLARYGCDLVTVERDICENILFTFCGFDAEQFNKTLLPVILGHEPAGTSTKTVIHYAQEIHSGKFQNFDYGETKNLAKYNSSMPPSYDLSKINIPIAFFYSDNDWLASPLDVKRLWTKIPNKINITRVNFTKFTHLDFLWGIDASSLVYNKLITMIKEHC
ncbi:lipase 3-like isoform X1 [Aphidius gifuensis]|uniref:lipase 3-like isoform X1 n=2 Tax=Aphidius gifuensis TaxID=684658 RepID=UPI001CDD762B|nr:lipase 3-like isoform X1 [Aphidius gifuensis]